MTGNANSVLLTDVDRQRLGTLLTRIDSQAVGSSRLRGKLERKLEDAGSVAVAYAPDTLVTMNSRVVVREMETGDKRTHTLVYPEDRDLADGSITVLQDLGCSLLGHRVGETVGVRDANQSKRYRIEELLFQPEAEGLSWL